MDSVAVFDSSVVLAVLYGEPGSDLVISRMRGALLSSVNLIEVHTKLLLNGMPRDAARKKIEQIRCEVCPLVEQHVRLASEMVFQTRPLGLSLGDRACLALGIERGATVFTTDRAWSSLSLGIEIQVIR